MTRWTVRNFSRGNLRHWMQASGSLSARLAATGEEFSVQVLNQGHQALSHQEAQALGIHQKSNAGLSGYVREVVLRIDGQAMVFARSVTWHANGAWRSVRGLGNRPLADVLFTCSGIQRQTLAFGKLARTGPMQRHVVVTWANATGENLVGFAMPARRSIFVRHGAKLLVMEVFAAKPACWVGSSTASQVKTFHRSRV